MIDKHWPSAQGQLAPRLEHGEEPLSVKLILTWIVGTIGLMGVFYLGAERGGNIAMMIMVLLLLVLSPSFYLSGVFLHEVIARLAFCGCVKRCHKNTSRRCRPSR